MDGQDGRGRKIRTTVELMMRFSRTHRRVVERMVSALGVHGGQHRLLMMLSLHKKLPTQKELARCMDITPASVANMLKRLESGGCIARSTGCSDGRCNEVEITPFGRRVVEDSCRIFECLDRRMLDGFSDGELETLSGYLERINENLRALEEESEKGERSQEDNREEEEVLKS